MDIFYLTASALPRLSLFVVTAGAAIYFTDRARRTPATGWLAIALWGFVVHHAAIIGFDTIASPAAEPILSGLTWSSVFMASWAFIGVAYGFLGASFPRHARRVLFGFGLLALASSIVIHLAFEPLSRRFSDTIVQMFGQMVGTITVVVLVGAAASILVRQTRTARADPVRRDKAQSATRSFSVILAAGMVIPVLGVFHNMELISRQLDEQVALVLWAILILGLITMYVNYDLEPTSVLVKVVAFGFMAVVTALGVASVVVFPNPLPIPGGPPQALRFVPTSDGGYRVESGEPLDERTGDLLPAAQNRQREVPLGFSFPFGGTTWTSVTVDEDGFLVFGDQRPTTLWDAMRSTDISLVAPLLGWTDADSSDVSVRRDSAQMTITWREASRVLRDDTVMFQVALRPDGEISFRYGNVPDSIVWVQGIAPGQGEPPIRRLLAPGLLIPSGEAPVIHRLADWRDAETRRAAPYAWLILLSGLVVLVVFPLYLRAGLTQPLRRLVAGVRRAARGHLDEEVTVGARDEIGRLTEDFNQMTRSLRQAETSLRNYADTLEVRVDERTAELATSLEELKATQARLIQQEKMASLGQLTAGIAHEIKNPLNFVNNFACLSQELVAELETETDPEEREALLDDLKANAAKIEAHGRRADAIVKAMMEHARSGSGERRSVNLNALVEEYAGLALHGMRARQPEATVDLDLQLDDGAGAVELAPQEIGRVLINLLDNAFDAVRQRDKALEGDPRVTVTTQREEGRVQIRVADNGIGIAPDVAEKVFEPFFTTKPTGQGTGLGLSMSYDIVTQGHGGALDVESTPGEGALFTLSLPVA
ncbi:MAG: ATP-binding protein [Bacteroidota bacterium]